MESITELDRAIEALQRPNERVENDAALLVSELSDGGNLTGQLKKVDVRVAALLRIAAIDDHFLYLHQQRREIINLIQDRLRETGSTVPKQYKLNNGDQADETCKRLARISPDALSRLEESISAYEGLQTLENFRTKLLQALNDDRARATVRPFVSLDGDPSDKLLKCISAAIEYRTSAAPRAKDSLAFALSATKEVLDGLIAQPTKVAQQIGTLVEQLRIDLRDHFDRSPLSKPAQLSLRCDLRRFPLHVPELEILVPIELLNDSEGMALDVEIELIDAIGVRPHGSGVRLSSMTPGRIIVEMSAFTDPQGMEGIDVAACQFKLSWMNTDGESRQLEVTADLLSQDVNVDWSKIGYENPYSLEAVDSEDDLIGRAGSLAQIARVLRTSSVGSLYVHGQKRVGKTSLAQVALEIMRSERDAKCIYVDAGGVNNPVPTQAINNLARELISELQKHFEFVPDEDDVDYDGSLAPMIRILKKVSAAKHPIIIAIDEFDRLPAPLYRRNAEGDAFFMALRSVANIRGVGLILIGGERMKLIINGPGVELNKFKPFPVDYLDQSTHWVEFEELVRKPTEQYLEFTDDACTAIYDVTAGNPYYTKLLCDKILELAAQRRDAYVDSREVESAVRSLLNSIDSTSFSHYWEDYVLEHDERRDEVTLDRRRCLLALGIVWSTGGIATSESVISEASHLGLSFKETERELGDFRERGFLSNDDGVWKARVALFSRWMLERGQSEIVISASELASVETVIAQRTSQRVKVSEADDLAKKFGTFRGTTFSGERVLEYLEQFGGARNQRLVFGFLKSIRFVSQADVNRMLEEAYSGLQQRLKSRHDSWSIKQVALSHTGGIEKSSLAMARNFKKANPRQLGTKNIRSLSELKALTDKSVTDVVVLDDFIGSGQTLVQQLNEIAVSLPEEMTVHVVVLAAMRDGLEAVRIAAGNLFNDRCYIECMYTIDNSPGPFDVASGFYANEEDAMDAKALVRSFGEQLEPRAPLGYGGCCAPLTFSDTIPNNAPAVLWSSSSGDFKFAPLFPRNS